MPQHDTLHVLAPITHGNLTIFPVVGGTDYDTSHILTLDEGIKAGSVIITEQGALRGLVRRGSAPSGSAEVNRLVLVNNSRLSVQPVSAEEWSIISRIAGLKEKSRS